MLTVSTHHGEPNMPLIEPFDTLDGDPARYVEYLRDCWRTAANTLRQPVQHWPRGTSHDVARQIQALAHARAQDMAIDYGLFDANGRLTGYLEGRAVRRLARATGDDHA